MQRAFDQYAHLKVSGDDIHSVIRGVSVTALADVLLRKYGLNDVKKGDTYPLQSYLSLLAEIEKRMPTVLHEIGRAIIHEALFPPDVTDFEHALELSDAGYYMNHQGAKPGEIGHYALAKAADGGISMIVDSPYPCIFDEGVVEGIAHKFETRISLTHEGDSCRRKGDAKCIYSIAVLGRSPR